MSLLHVDRLTADDLRGDVHGGITAGVVALPRVLHRAAPAQVVASRLAGFECAAGLLDPGSPAAG